jgi:hypothetical protein
MMMLVESSKTRTARRKQRQLLPSSMKLNRPLQIEKQVQIQWNKSWRDAGATTSTAGTACRASHDCKNNY